MRVHHVWSISAVWLMGWSGILDFSSVDGWMEWVSASSLRLVSVWGPRVRGCIRLERGHGVLQLPTYLKRMPSSKATGKNRIMYCATGHFQDLTTNHSLLRS
jgi:hypothetical protein